MTNPHFNFKYTSFKPYRGFKVHYFNIGWQTDKRNKQYGYLLERNGYIYFSRLELYWNL